MLKCLRPAALAALCLLLPACPGPPAYKPQLRPASPDEYSAFGQAMRSEDGFRQELKLLQEQFTEPPDPGYAQPGDAQAHWTLGSEVKDGELRIVFEPGGGGQQWQLGVYQLPAGQSGPLRIDKSEAKAGGFKLEATAGRGEELSISVNGRWVQGRYLQLAREIVLNTLDGERTLASEETAWTLWGPAVPLRMMPSAGASYGRMDQPGAVTAAVYPTDLAIPAAAAYDSSGGFLAMVAHSSVKDLTRTYAVSVNPGKAGPPGQLAELALSIYDPTKDAYGPAFIVTGLPLRDMLVVEPLSFALAEADADAQATLQAVEQLGQMYRAFVAAPQLSDSELPPTLLLGTRQGPDDWAKWIDAPPATLKVLVNSGDALAAACWVDEKNWLSLDPAYPGGEQGKSEASLFIERLSGLGDPPLPVFLGWDMLRIDPAGVIARMDQAAMLAQPAANYATEQAGAGGPGTGWLNIRQPEAMPWMLRNAMLRAAAEPRISLFSPDYLSQELPSQPSSQGPFYGSYEAAAVAAELRLAIAQQEKSAGRPLLMLGLPRACRPVYAEACALSAAQPGLQAQMVSALFGVRAYVGLESPSLAALLLEMNQGTGGVILHPGMQANSGFDAFVKNIDAAVASSGKLRLLTADSAGGAAQSGVTVGMRPNPPAGNSAVFIVFQGAGGGISINEYNLMTVSWEGGSSQVQLPPGIWEVQTPEPDNIQAGDVAVVTKRFLTAPGEPTGNTDI